MSDSPVDRPESEPVSIASSEQAAASFLPGSVHLWQFEISRPADEVARLAGLLSDDEQSRAGRFTAPGLRERFIAGRGLLRTILGRYLNVSPERIAFRYNGYGKPAIAEPDSSPVAFNLSHSGDLALVGLAHSRQIGVDIERHRPEVNCRELANHFFAQAEIAALAATPDEQLAAAFFACWTRKEAYIKAVGRGLSTPLDGFAVNLEPEGPARLLAVHDSPAEVDRWRVETLRPAPGYSAAVCVEHPVYEMRQFSGP